MVEVMIATLVACVSALAGMAWGRWTLGRSITLFSDDPDRRGAHEIAGRFWYLVPESEYVRRFLARPGRAPDAPWWRWPDPGDDD